jgi:HK97 family phage major capsid protein
VPVTEVPPGLGSAITPEQWSQYVLTHLSEQSVVLASGATRIVTGQRVVHVPRVGAASADWFGELEEITEQGPSGDELKLQPLKVATISKLSDESVSDSDPDVLDVVGTQLTRAVALEADRAILTGQGGKEPVGVFGQAGGHVISATITLDSLVEAAGEVITAGGSPRAAYLNPTDYSALLREKDQNGRPLLQPDYSATPSSTVYGLVLWPTSAIAPGMALVADPSHIIVAVRNDPTIAVSSDALFTSDGTVCRCIARVDAGIGDARALVSIGATAQAAASESKAAKK